MTQRYLSCFTSLLLLVVLAIPCASYAQEGWISYKTTNSGIAQNRIHDIVIVDDVAWIATYGGGISKYDMAADTWTTYNTSNSSLLENDINIIVHVGSVVYFGQASRGIVSFDGTDWVRYTKDNSGLTNDTINDMSVDTQGRLWVATQGGGLCMFDGTDWTVYNTTNSGLRNNQILSVHADGGIVWAGSNGAGLYRFDGSTWTEFNTNNSDVHSNTVAPIYRDRTGKMWFGSASSGLATFDGSNWTVYNTTNSSLLNNTIISIYEDPYGVIWVGSDNAGIYRIDGSTWITYTPDNSGLEDGTIFTIAVPNERETWFGSDGMGIQALVTPPNSPSNVRATLNPDVVMEGVTVDVEWNPSPDEAELSGYNIYRSLTPILTDPVAFDSYETPGAFYTAELTTTIYMGTVAPGTTTYSDSYMFRDGAVYYYWVAAVISGSAVSTLSQVNQTIQVYRYADPPQNVWSFQFAGGLRVNWEASADNDYIDHYIIYRSQNPEFNDPVAVSSFGSVAEAQIAEQTRALILADADKDSELYLDNYGLQEGVAYYYWVQGYVDDLLSTDTVRAPSPVSYSEDENPVSPPEDPTVSFLYIEGTPSNVMTWTLSADDDNLQVYNIYRSRYPALTNPVPVSNYTSLEALHEAEANTTIFLGTVPAGSDSYVDDYGLMDGGIYYYWISAVHDDSRTSVKIRTTIPSVEVEDESEPYAFALTGAYPNPFNPTTTIAFTINAESAVSLEVYNLTGQKVRTLVDSHLSTGTYSRVWNGRDDSGRRVSSGIYIARLVTESAVSTMRMTLIK